MIEAIIIHGGRRGGQFNLQIPENWNELRAEQLPRLAAALMAIKDQDIKKVEIARILMGWEDKYFKRVHPGVMMETILPLCKWTEEAIDLTEQLLPQIIIGETVLHGPKSMLANLRLIEWDFSERAITDWFDEPDKLLQLARLVAILYRPAKEGYDFIKDPDGDCRAPFNDNLIEYYAALILELLPVPVLFAIMFWYRGCRNAITEEYRSVFDTDGKSHTPSEPGYFDLMRAIAKEGIYGDFDKVENMYLSNALQELQCAKDEAEAMRLQQKKRS